ncbi:MAG: hypothetical protein WBA31_11325 [Candidatus Dormiibacterota bacterium]
MTSGVSGGSPVSGRTAKRGDQTAVRGTLRSPASTPGWWKVAGAAALLALVIRLATLLMAHHLSGVFEYDDGVYFGSAVMLILGHLPYRDFVLIQPPGLTLLLTPFALLSRWTGTDRALELARLMVPLVAACNVLLLARVLRHRSWLVLASACLLLAVYPDDILASTALLLEPFLIFFCLLALVAAFDGDRLTSSAWRVFWAGAALGFGADIKLWAAFPAVILLLLCLPRPSRVAGLIGGALVGALVPSLPFLVAAPAAFWHQVVVDQVGRAGVSALSPVIRLEFLTGVWPGLGVPAGHLYQLLAAVATGGIAVVVLTAFATRLGRPRDTHGASSRGPSQLELFAIGCTLLTAVALLVPADFFYHYAAFLGPFLALLMGLAVGRLETVRPKPILGLVALIGAVGLIHALAIPLLVEKAPITGAEIAALIPAGSCVVTDDPEYTLTANRYLAASPGCPELVDGLGTTIAISGSQNPTSQRAQRAGPAWLSYFRRAGYLVLTPLSGSRIPWDHALEGYLETHFRLISKSPVVVLGRRSLPLRHKVPLPLPQLAGSG